MPKFHIGDEVVLAGLPHSEWRDARGKVVEITSYCSDAGTMIEECCVCINGQRRWFLATHLLKSVSPRYLKFFRAEVLDRWRLNPDSVPLLNGSCEQLTRLLVNNYGFPICRAEVEVAQFAMTFTAKTSRSYDREAA